MGACSVSKERLKKGMLLTTPINLPLGWLKSHGPWERGGRASIFGLMLMQAVKYVIAGRSGVPSAFV